MENTYKPGDMLESEAVKEKIGSLVRTTEMQVNSMDGPCGIPRKMAGLEFDGNFVAVPPVSRWRGVFFLIP
jgi:hypothetical protein